MCCPVYVKIWILPPQRRSVVLRGVCIARHILEAYSRDMPRIMPRVERRVMQRWDFLSEGALSRGSLMACPER